MSLEERYQKQLAVFEKVYARVRAFLGDFADQNSLSAPRDYSIYDDYWGYPQIKVTLGNFRMLRPSIVKAL